MFTETFGVSSECNERLVAKPLASLAKAPCASHLDKVQAGNVKEGPVKVQARNLTG